MVQIGIEPISSVLQTVALTIIASAPIVGVSVSAGVSVQGRYPNHSHPHSHTHSYPHSHFHHCTVGETRTLKMQILNLPRIPFPPPPQFVTLTW